MRLVRLATYLAFALSALAVIAPDAEAACTFHNAIVSNGQTFHSATCHNNQGGKKCVCTYTVCFHVSQRAYCMPLISLKKP